MSRNDLTFRDILFFSQADLPDSVRSYIEATAAVVEMKEKLEKSVRGLDWGPLGKRIADRVLEVLDVGIAQEVLVKVWNEGGLFQKYLQGEKASPDDTFEVALVDHSIRSVHHPGIEITLNDVPLRSIELEVTVKLTVKGAVLEIQSGKIKSLETGELKGKGEIRCEGFLLLSEELPPVHLKGKKVFEDGGIAILS
jgi:hypothetical protein